jgi:uncharacterized protein YqeY
MKALITSSIKEAMKGKESQKLEVLRAILSKITEGEKANSNQELTDAQCLQVIEKLSKQREEALVLYRQAGRQDLIDKEQYQLDVLKAYLPQKKSYEETESKVNELVNSGVKDMGALMKSFSDGTWDKKLVSEIVKKKLNG